MKVKDHTGKEYKSLQIMCDLYGIWTTTYKRRLSRGWSLKDCLTYEPPGYTDHEGNHFKSIREMAEHWGITEHRLEIRMSRGWSLRDALTLRRYRHRKK